MNKYLSQFEIENMNEADLSNTYRQIFNLIALKERAIDEISSLYLLLRNIKQEIQKRNFTM